MAGADKTWKICCYFARHTAVSPIESRITAVTVNSCATWLMSCDRSQTILDNGNLCAFTRRKLVCLFNSELCIYIFFFFHSRHQVYHPKCGLPLSWQSLFCCRVVYSTMCSGSCITSQADIIMLVNDVVFAPLAPWSFLLAVLFLI